MKTFHFAFLCGCSLHFARIGQERTAFAAGPTSESPQTFLALWSDDSVAPQPSAVYSQAIKLYESLPEDVEKYEAAIKAGKVARLKRMEVGRTKFLNEHLDHLASLLKAWGEPAGYDLHQRSKELAFRINTIHTALMNAAETQSQINSSKVQQYAKKNEKKLVQIRKLTDEKKFDAAEKLFLPLYLDLVSAGCWYEYNQRLAMIGNYDREYTNLTTTQLAAMNQLARQTTVELANQLRPDFGELTNRLTQLKLSPEGVADWEGASLAGPKLAAALFASLQSVYGQTQRTHAIAFASVDLGQAPPEAEKLRADYQAYLVATIDAVGRIIDADASRATSEEATQLYGGYLAAICGFAGKLSDTSEVEKLSDALEKLAAKSEALSADVNSYRSATSDWLRWRNRAALSAMKTRTAKSPAFSLKSKGPLGQIESSAPQIIGAATKLLGDQSLVAETGLLAAADKMCYSQQDGAVALCVSKANVDVEAILGGDLLVSKGKIPLTLEAGLAYAGARRGNLAAAGGKLASIKLVGTIPLEATDFPFRTTIFPADTITAANSALASTRADQVVYLVTLDPDWLAGKHYFVATKPGTD